MTHSFPTRRSSDLVGVQPLLEPVERLLGERDDRAAAHGLQKDVGLLRRDELERRAVDREGDRLLVALRGGECHGCGHAQRVRSEEHTSELQSLMRISYAVFCLKKKHTLY